MNKAFVNFTWQNTPSISTPLNASNLNSVNNALDTVDDRVVAMDTSKANVADLLTDVVNVAYNATTGVWTFTRRNGTTFTFDQNVEKIPVSFSMSSAGVITMTTADGTEYTCDISTLIKLYTFQDSSVIDFTTTTDASGNKTITATIVAGSITDSMLQTNYLADITVQAQNAAGSANSALGSANSANADALLAQSYAVGNSGIRTGEDTDNSKYYKEQCALSGEAWTRGTKNGQPVPNTDETYHNNAKYFAEQSESYVEDAEAWAKGTRNGVPVTSSDPAYHNNAEYFKDEAAQYVGALTIPDAQWQAIELLI